VVGDTATNSSAATRNGATPNGATRIGTSRAAGPGSRAPGAIRSTPSRNGCGKDRERQAPRGEEEDYGRARGRYGAGDRGEGRGSYASSGREWGESDRQYWQNRHGGQRAQSGPERSEYPQRGDLSQSGQAGGYGAYGSDRDIEPDRGMRSRGRGQDHSTGSNPWAGTTRTSVPVASTTPSASAPAWASACRARASAAPMAMPPGPRSPIIARAATAPVGKDQSGRHFDSGGEREESRYGSRGGWDLGTRQREAGRPQERSFRGMGPQHYKRPDERIRDDVYERLTESHMVDARFVSVDVSEGNVTLTGTVTERRMRYAAEDLVEGVMGVSNINNQLQVQGNDKGKDKET
jgi:hypothetical protein